jgi:hypothetical protein
MNLNEFEHLVEANFSPELVEACKLKLKTLREMGVKVVEDPMDLLEEIEVEAFKVNDDSARIMSTALRM